MIWLVVLGSTLEACKRQHNTPPTDAGNPTKRAPKPTRRPPPLSLQKATSQLLLAIMRGDYQRFRQLTSDAVHTQFTQRDLLRLRGLLQQMGRLEQTNLKARPVSYKDKLAARIVLRYPKGKCFLYLAIQGDKIIQFRFDGSSLKQAIRNIIKTNKKKLSLVRFALLDNKGKPFPKLAAYPPGKRAFRLAIRGLKQQGGTIKASLTLSIERQGVKPKLVKLAESRELRVPTSIKSPLLPIKGQLKFSTPGDYTLTFTVTDEHKQEKAYLTKKLTLR